MQCFRFDKVVDFFAAAGLITVFPIFFVFKIANYKIGSVSFKLPKEGIPPKVSDFSGAYSFRSSWRNRRRVEIFIIVMYNKCYYALLVATGRFLYNSGND